MPQTPTTEPGELARAAQARLAHTVNFGPDLGAARERGWTIDIERSDLEACAQAAGGHEPGAVIGAGARAVGVAGAGAGAGVAGRVAGAGRGPGGAGMNGRVPRMRVKRFSCVPMLSCGFVPQRASKRSVCIAVTGDRTCLGSSRRMSRASRASARVGPQARRETRQRDNHAQ
jgi:hypothetical protein